MADAYVGEIRMFAGNFAPVGWAFCDGQLLPISENEILFNVIGTTYGGDGQANFALPDLRGRIPVHMGANIQIGQSGGTESVTLLSNQIPAHSHPAFAKSANGDQTSPGATTTWAASTLNQYSPVAANANMNAAAIGLTGGSQSHNNMMPYLTVSFIISLFGLFPNPN
jgi:microcystin-dependent protein